VKGRILQYQTVAYTFRSQDAVAKMS